MERGAILDRARGIDITRMCNACSRRTSGFILTGMLTMLSGAVDACEGIFQQDVFYTSMMSANYERAVSYLDESMGLDDSISGELLRGLQTSYGGGFRNCGVLVHEEFSEIYEEFSVLLEGDGTTLIVMMARAVVGGRRKPVYFHFTADFAEFIEKKN